MTPSNTQTDPVGFRHNQLAGESLGQRDVKIKQLLGTPTDVFKLSGELITIGINTASKDQLKSLPGIGDTYAQKIIDGRPYTKKDQLVSKKIVPEGAYDEITDWIIAKQPKK